MTRQYRHAELYAPVKMENQRKSYAHQYFLVRMRDKGQCQYEGHDRYQSVVAVLVPVII